MIQALLLKGTGAQQLEPTLEGLQAAIRCSECALWVDVEGGPTEEFATLGSALGFHPLAIEDALGHVEQPKLDDYGSYLYIVAHGLECSTDASDIRVLELDLFLGPNYLVTYHHEPLHCIKVLWDRTLHDGRYPQRGADGLAHAALDLLVDDLMPVLDRLDATIEELEDEILTNPTQKTLMRILDVKRATLHLRRTIVPQREVAYRLGRDISPLVRPKTQPYFRDVYDHLVRITDINESLRDLVSGALDIYLSVTSNRLNEVMKFLTLVATVFMPLTLLSGIYGMNFHYMPELEWRYGYFAVLGVMALVAVSMVHWFRRRGWL